MNRLLGIAAPILFARLACLAQPAQPLTGPPIFPLNEDAYLRWPLPPSAQKYGAIDGLRLKPYVRELSAISAKSRDEGNQWWGRITGAPSHAEAQRWTADQFRRIG